MSRSRTPVWVLVAVLSVVVLGALAPATAATLSKGTVKKIAAKVVTSHAPSLSVAHAASADRAASAGDADTVGGRSAASLQTAVRTYLIPPGNSAPFHEFAFPGLDPGSYLVSYSLALTSAPAGAVSCFLKTELFATDSLGYTSVGYASTGPTCDNTALVTIVAGKVPTLRVNGTGLTAIASGNAPSSVVFTRVDSVSTGSPTGA